MLKTVFCAGLFFQSPCYLAKEMFKILIVKCQFTFVNCSSRFNVIRCNKFTFVCMCVHML